MGGLLGSLGMAPAKLTVPHPLTTPFVSEMKHPESQPRAWGEGVGVARTPTAGPSYTAVRFSAGKPLWGQCGNIEKLKKCVPTAGFPLRK